LVEKVVMAEQVLAKAFHHGRYMVQALEEEPQAA
jgi:hypothetical protein